MTDNKGFRKNSGKYEVETSTLIQTFEFSWAMENFPQWPDTFKVTSEEFQPAKDIILYAMFERFVDESGDCKCYLKLLSKGTTSFRIKLSHSIVGSDGKVFQDVKDDIFACNELNKINSYIVSPKKIIEFSDSVEDQKVIFKWVLETCGLTTKNVCRKHPQNSSDLLPTIIEDFKSMYADSIYTDLSLLVENSVLRVHKSVLCARSPVFAKMLKSPMEEKEKDTIGIPDIELPIMKYFVEFLYTGNMSDADFETAHALYYAADKYNVPTLQKACADVLLDKLDVENTCRVLSLANRHSDEQLKELVLEFMQFEFDAILGTEYWIDFVKVETDLAVEVMKLRGQKFEKRSSS